METSRLSFKLFFDPPAGFEVTQFVPVFHSWIQSHAIADHLLIDVADYSHVHNGPGVVLVSHEANYSLDSRGGRWGLTYQRKQPISGTFAQRLRIAYQAVQKAAELLSEKLKFRKDEIEFRICDRLAAPNDPATLEAVKGDLLKLFPNGRLEGATDKLSLLEISIRV
jgi:hypothetical protein